MVNIGEYAQCPQCTRMGRIVWVSKDGKLMGVQCHTSHSMDNHPNSYGFKRPPSKANKDSVFLVNTGIL